MIKPQGSWAQERERFNAMKHRPGDSLTYSSVPYAAIYARFKLRSSIPIGNRSSNMHHRLHLVLGLNIFMLCRQFSLGHAAFFGSEPTPQLSSPSQETENYVIFILVLFLGAAVAGLVAFSSPSILRLRSDYLGIATLGFGIIVKVRWITSIVSSP